MKPILTFDIDNVIFQTGGRIAKLPMMYNSLYPLADIFMHNLPKRIVSRAADILIKNGQLAIPEAPEIISRIREDYDIVFLSGRPPAFMIKTIRQFADAGIRITEDSLVMARTADKFRAIKSIGSILHVDDSASTIKSCLAHGQNHCMISNERTAYNHCLRDAARWAYNLRSFYIARDYFIRYSKAISL